MAEYDNEGRITLWKEKTGDYGPYVAVNFQLNGVEYHAFAEKVKSTNPKAPAYSGKLKVRGGQVQKPATAPVTNAGSDLPF